MTCHPRRRFAGTLVLLAALLACDEPSPTTLDSIALESTDDLDFVLPTLRPEDLVLRQSGEPIQGLGPARVAPDYDEEREESALARVLEPQTIVSFTRNGASSEGRHRVHGNHGKVRTTLSLSFMGRSLGSQTAASERSWLFALPTGSPRIIVAYAQMYSEATCGLTARGESYHEAEFRVLWGATRTTLSSDGQSTLGGPITKDRCRERIAGYDPTENTDIDQGLQCTYRIWYDRDTYEIVEVELLGCETTGNPEF